MESQENKSRDRLTYSIFSFDMMCPYPTPNSLYLCTIPLAISCICHYSALSIPRTSFLSKIKLGNVFWHLHPAILGQHQYLYYANFNLWCNWILKLNEIIFVVKLLCFFSFVIWWVCSVWNVKRIRKYYSLYKWMDLQLPVGINIFAIEFEYDFLFRFIMHYLLSPLSFY